MPLFCQTMGRGSAFKYDKLFLLFYCFHLLKYFLNPNCSRKLKSKRMVFSWDPKVLFSYSSTTWYYSVQHHVGIDSFGWLLLLFTELYYIALYNCAFIVVFPSRLSVLVKFPLFFYSS